MAKKIPTKSRKRGKNTKSLLSPKALRSAFEADGEPFPGSDEDIAEMVKVAQATDPDADPEDTQQSVLLSMLEAMEEADEPADAEDSGVEEPPEEDRIIPRRDEPEADAVVSEGTAMEPDEDSGVVVSGEEESMTSTDEDEEEEEIEDEPLDGEANVDLDTDTDEEIEEEIEDEEVEDEVLVEEDEDDAAFPNGCLLLEVFENQASEEEGQRILRSREEREVLRVQSLMRTLAAGFTSFGLETPLLAVQYSEVRSVSPKKTKSGGKKKKRKTSVVRKRFILFSPELAEVLGSPVGLVATKKEQVFCLNPASPDDRALFDTFYNTLVDPEADLHSETGAIEFTDYLDFEVEALTDIGDDITLRSLVEGGAPETDDTDYHTLAMMLLTVTRFTSNDQYEWSWDEGTFTLTEGSTTLVWREDDDDEDFEEGWYVNGTEYVGVFPDEVSDAVADHFDNDGE